MSGWQMFIGGVVLYLLVSIDIRRSGQDRPLEEELSMWAPYHQQVAWTMLAILGTVMCFMGAAQILGGR